MMVHGVPVGDMFHAGAPSIARSEVSVLPCRPSESRCVLVEAYPALLVRQLLPCQSYKEDRARGGSLAQQRAALWRCCSQDVKGLSLAGPVGLAEGIIADTTGDQLDAVLWRAAGSAGRATRSAAGYSSRG